MNTSWLFGLGWKLAFLLGFPLFFGGLFWILNHPGRKTDLSLLIIVVGTILVYLGMYGKRVDKAFKTAAIADVVTVKVKCHACGHLNEEQNSFCGKCGNKI